MSEPQEVSDILDGLTDPSADEVYQAVREYDTRHVVAAVGAKADDGGGGGGSQIVTRETFTGTNNGILDGEAEQLAWVHASGDVLVNLTDPLVPVIVTEGVYAVAARAAVASMTVGGSWVANLDLDADGADQGVQGESALSSAANGSAPQISLGLTYYIPAGGTLAFWATNRDGVATRVFNIIAAYIQRLA